MASSNVDIPEPRHIPPELIYHIIRELVLLDPEGCLKLSEHEQHTHGTGSGRSPSSWLAVTSFNIEVVQELRRAALVSKAWAQACAPLLWRVSLFPFQRGVI